MDKEQPEARGKISLQFRCTKILSESGKSSEPSLPVSKSMKVDDIQDSTGLTSPTPEKKVLPPRSRTKVKALSIKEEIRDTDNFLEADGATSLSCMLLQDNLVEVPEKYCSTVEFFDRLECSVRLLHLRKKLSSFQNISAQVEVLTKRKFMHSHLAQIKYVFPEAILIEKILRHDEKSLCIVPDMKITVSLDAVKLIRNEKHSASKALRQAFRVKLLNFVNAQAKDVDIPEASLPEPFNGQNQFGLQKPLFDESLGELLPPSSIDNASHLPPSFRKHFSHKILDSEAEDTGVLASQASARPICTDSGEIEEAQVPVRKGGSSSASFNVSPSRLLSSPSCSQAYQHCETTPSKTVFSLGNLMLATPDLQTPKIIKVDSPAEKLDGETTTPMHSARKSLAFSPQKTANNAFDHVISMTGSTGTVLHPCHQMEDVGHISIEERLSRCQSGSMEMEGTDATGAMDQKMDISKRQQILASLPGLSNTITLIFQSIKCRSITKQELIHKILLHNIEIEDTEVVEEQLQLLEDLVPDWICKETLSSGDLIYCIERKCDPESVHARLVEAA